MGMLLRPSLQAAAAPLQNLEGIFSLLIVYYSLTTTASNNIVSTLNYNYNMRHSTEMYCKLHDIFMFLVESKPTGRVLQAGGFYETGF